MSDEQLAALERDYAHWQKALDEGCVQTGDFILGRLTPALLDAFPGLVQRLRKAEADLFLSNQLALEDWTSSRQHIAALERVRDAAERHTVHSDRTSAADLVAALETLRLTENATTPKGNSSQ